MGRVISASCSQNRRSPGRNGLENGFPLRGTEGSNPVPSGWPKVAGARLPPSPPLIYLLSNEVLLPERAGGRDRFVAG
jgi:hypothetical protein